MRRRRSAWGSVHEVTPGVWRVRYWGKDAKGVYRRMSSTVRGSRVDAERRRSELMLAHSEDAPCPTVGEAWRTWHLPSLEERHDAGELSSQTLSQYRSAWRVHIAPRWEDVPCDAVRPLEVQQWISQLTTNQARGALNVMQPLMDYAVRYGFVGSNPMRERYVMPPRRTVSKGDRGVWALTELREVWGAVCGEWFEAAFLLSAFGGLRVGEALGVIDSDVSASHGCALVEVVRQVANHPVHVTDRLKNRQSSRFVAIPGAAGARLLQISHACDGWLSGDGLGSFNTQGRLGRSWNAALSSLDPSMRHPFRNLRNSWETNARWSLGLDSWGIEVMLGHVAPGVTGRHYDRPSSDMIARVIAEAYSASPFDAKWPQWDDLGLKDFMHTV